MHCFVWIAASHSLSDRMHRGYRSETTMDSVAGLCRKGDHWSQSDSSVLNCKLLSADFSYCVIK